MNYFKIISTSSITEFSESKQEFYRCPVSHSEFYIPSATYRFGDTLLVNDISPDSPTPITVVFVDGQFYEKSSLQQSLRTPAIAGISPHSQRLLSQAELHQLDVHDVDMYAGFEAKLTRLFADVPLGMGGDVDLSAVRTFLEKTYSNMAGNRDEFLDFCKRFKLDEFSLLGKACQYADVPLIRFLHSVGYDFPNDHTFTLFTNGPVRNKRVLSPVGFAVFAFLDDLRNDFRDLGCDFNQHFIRDYDVSPTGDYFLARQYSLLGYSCIQNNENQIKFLLENGLVNVSEVSFSSWDNNGNLLQQSSPLAMACSRQALRAISALFDCGVTLSNDSGRVTPVGDMSSRLTAFGIACEERSAPVIRTLHSILGDINSREPGCIVSNSSGEVVSESSLLYVLAQSSDSPDMSEEDSLDSIVTVRNELAALGYDFNADQGYILFRGTDEQVESGMRFPFRRSVDSMLVDKGRHAVLDAFQRSVSVSPDRTPLANAFHRLVISAVSPFNKGSSE